MTFADGRKRSVFVAGGRDIASAQAPADAPQK